MIVGVVDVILSRRALNRATLARQLLLERSDRSPLDVVAHLVGMQAQVPLDPYLGLWSRLRRFQPTDLAQLLVDRHVVRLPVMRATIHLVTADDCLFLRPLAQPVLDAELARHPEFAPALRDVDIDAAVEVARELLAERPRTGRQLRTLLAERFPGDNAAALAYACRNRLALVQVPPRGVWGQSAQVTSTTAEAWLGRPLQQHPAVDEAVLRYLAAFGPATTADMATWSRLTGFREVVDRLRPRLRTFRDERGRELFDVPDAPLPDPDTPAPPRFLPEYDNVVLSHADRSRFMPVEPPAGLFDTSEPFHGTMLDDGILGATWAIARDRSTGRATLTVRHLPLPKRRRDAITTEARRMLAFRDPEATDHEVRLIAVS